MISTYPHQNTMIDQARRLMANGCRRILMQSATGSGKTVMNASIFKSAMHRGKRCWFTVHRRELVRQSVETFKMFGINPGICASGYQPDLRNPIQVCSIDTLRSRAHYMIPPDLIAVDECHHEAARTWSSLTARFPKVYKIGWTATPQRLDGRGLREHYDEMVHGPSPRWLIDNGYLSDYVYYAPELFETSGIGTTAGDFSMRDASGVANKPSITGCAIEHYKNLVNGRRAIVFCCDINHSMSVTSMFREAGIPSDHVDGKKDRKSRDECISRFIQGDTLVLTNVNLFGEGFDVPSIEAVIQLRPTKSLSLFLQWCGRALRTFEGKSNAVILDHCRNIERPGFGLPDDDRDWTLDGRTRRSSKTAQVIAKECPRCYRDNPNRSVKCLFCGYEFVKREREVLQIEGELKEVKRRNRIAARIERVRAKSLDDLRMIERRKGYKHGWAEHVWRSRMNKKRKGY